MVIELRCKLLGIVSAHFEGDEAADVPKERTLHLLTKLRLELVEECKGDAPVAALRECIVKLGGGKILKLVDVGVEVRKRAKPCDRIIRYCTRKR